jgi:hypothetical protein
MLWLLRIAETGLAFRKKQSRAKGHQNGYFDKLLGKVALVTYCQFLKTTPAWETLYSNS